MVHISLYLCACKLWECKSAQPATVMFKHSFGAIYTGELANLKAVACEKLSLQCQHVVFTTTQAYKLVAGNNFPQFHAIHSLFESLSTYCHRLSAILQRTFCSKERCYAISVDIRAARCHIFEIAEFFSALLSYFLVYKRFIALLYLQVY